MAVHLWIKCITWCISAFMLCSQCAFVDNFCGQLHLFHEYNIPSPLFCAFLRMYYTCIHYPQFCLSVFFLHSSFHSVVIVYCMQVYDYPAPHILLCIQYSFFHIAKNTAVSYQNSIVFFYNIKKAVPLSKDSHKINCISLIRIFF